VIGYNLYRATASGGPYSKLNSALISGSSFVDNNVVTGQTYYYVATAVDDGGLESTYSNHATAPLN
jgi:fibronectin type 3 domain-containing protein